LNPPPIRYPLPTLVSLIALVILGRFAVSWTRPVRSALAARWTRVVEGPPVPSSREPKVATGPIVRRVLLLRDGTDTAERPGGRITETIGRRMFADVYDTWPLDGPPAFYRIGNRRPFGWVPSAVVLPWDTRLVIRPEGRPITLTANADDARAHVVETSGMTLPIVDWSANRIRIAVWNRDRPWQDVERMGWVDERSIDRAAWGALVSREELLMLLRRLERPERDEPAESLRLRAILGRMGEVAAFKQDDIIAARGALPGACLLGPRSSDRQPIERLSRINEKWTPVATWSGLSFDLVPLDALP
jgi:hypothetical protein